MSEEVRLLHLPDDLLQKIFKQQLRNEPHESFQLLHAISLSHTCRRLYHLFPPCLHTIDERRDWGCDPPPFNVLRPKPYRCNLPVIAARAASALRVCHLPGLSTAHLVEALSSLSAHCPSLEHLSFTETSDLRVQSVRTLFQSCQQLRKLHVLKPGQFLFNASPTPGQLKDLTLLQVDSRCITAFIQFLRKHCAGLTSLHVGLTGNKYSVTSGPPWFPLPDDLRALLQFAKIQLITSSPLLETLQIDTEPSPALEHHHLDHSAQSFTSTLEYIQGSVSHAREREPNGRRKIRRVALQASLQYYQRCFAMLSNLVGKESDVFVQVPGIGVEFPAGLGASDFYFRNLQLSTGAWRVVGNFSISLDRLESLDVGSGYAVDTFLNGPNELSFPIANWLASKTGRKLTRLRATIPFKNKCLKHACDYVAKILRAVPHVSYLELSFDAIYIASESKASFIRMIAEMQNIRTLRLVSPQRFSRTRWNPHALEFLNRLPAMLGALQKCSNLKAVYLETPLPPFGNWSASVQMGDLRGSFKALQDLELAHPTINVQSIRTELQTFADNAAFLSQGDSYWELALYGRR